MEQNEDNKVGRPTVMTPEVIAKLEEAFSNGATDLEACFLANISKDALYDYQNKYPQFSERKEALKEMVKYQARKNIVGKIKDGDVPTSQWFAERKMKDEFSSRTEVTGRNGDGLQPLLVKFIGDEKETRDNGDTSRVQEAF